MKKYFLFPTILIFVAASIELQAQTENGQLTPTAQTTNQMQKMETKHVTVNQAVNSTPQKIWDILKTGDDLDKWIPFISSCELQGKGAGAERICTTPEGKQLKETILSVDHKNRIFRYRIDKQDMLPLTDYVGTVKVLEVNGMTEVHWSAEFVMTMEEAYPQVEQGLTQMLTLAISGLDAAAR